MQKGILISFMLIFPLASALGMIDAYQSEIDQFREKREAGLKRDDSWLTVAGLFWLTPGETKVGSASSNDVVLPASAPASVGVLTLTSEGKATFQPEPGVKITLKDKPFEGGAISADAKGGPDILSVGDLRLILIKRGARYAIRLKDNQSAIRKNFSGLDWFPVSESWKIRGKFIPNDGSETKSVIFDTIVGTQETMQSPGEVEFEVDGKTFRFLAVKEGDQLWFVFRDTTSGKTTHGGARQLYAPLPKDGVVELDFNRATNLPCAYTPFATCPIAPKQNRLPIEITAGENKYEPKH